MGTATGGDASEEGWAERGRENQRRRRRAAWKWIRGKNTFLPLSLLRLVYRPATAEAAAATAIFATAAVGLTDRQTDDERGACMLGERKERDTERREGLKSGTSGTAQKTKICSASLRSHCQTACQSVRLLVAGMMLYCGLLKGLQGMSTMSGKVKWPREFLQLALPGTARAGEVHYVCDMCRGGSTDLHSKCRQVVDNVPNHIVRVSH